jgi:hypothetical protein
MSSEHQPQTERPDRPAAEPAVATAQSDTALPASVPAPAIVAPRGPLAHATARSLRQDAILRAERHQGNRHVARLIAQRQGADGGAPAAAEAAPPGADPAPTGLIVDDTVAQVGPGQLKKSEFLAQLRAAVASAAAAALAGTPWAADAEPEIDRRLAAYATLDAAALERTLRQELPDAAGVTTAAGFLPLAAARVRAAIAEQLPPAALAGDIQGVVAAAVAGVGRVASAVAGAASAVAGGIGGALSAIGAALFKRRPGATGDAMPTVLRAELGEGQPLAGGLQTGMGAALGHDFSRVRVHTGGQAGALVNRLNARALAVGEDVAFAEGEYRPGTLVGDALIAHELAHVVQQRGAVGAGAQRTSDAETGALEEEADAAAAGTVVALHGGGRPELAALQQPALPRLRAGLRLQLSSCFSSTRASSTLLEDFRRDFPEPARLIDRSPAAQGIVRDAERAGSRYGGFAEDGPAHGTWAYTVGSTVYIPRARTDHVQAMSDFLFELNNAIRAPQFRENELRAAAGTVDARQYARRKIELEVEGMLRLGEAWFEIKRAAGDASWDRYDEENYLRIYQDVHDGRKTQTQVVDEVLQWRNGMDRSRTNEQYYMDQYPTLRGTP